MFKEDDIVVSDDGRWRHATPAEIAAFEASQITWKGFHTQATTSTTSSIFWELDFDGVKTMSRERND